MGNATSKPKSSPEGSPYIVAIGASAGGLEAQRALLRELPRDLPAAFVIVQHLSPDHVSLLSKILSPETDLEVLDLQDGAAPKVNTVYVTPPSNDIIYKDGVFRLVAPSLAYATPKPSVDRLLISLAEEHGERSVAIILSGTGSDGAYGVQAIRSVGGITIAQDDQTAKYSGMPVSAVETGCVDLILSPQEIGVQLGGIIKSPEDLLTLKQSLTEQSPETELLKMVLVRNNVDFRDYKPSTIQRRIERRMLAHSISEPLKYIEYCKANSDEVDAFFKDMLISVTSFFRDRQEFDSMKSVVSQIVEARPDKPIRVWVAGCATGQEAYSIAMLFTQVLGEIGGQRNINLKVYGTDINADALRIARKGVYPISSITEIPDEFLEKYVEVLKDHIVISRTISDRIIFTEHNIMSDVPFSEIDLICCRNLLIYMNQSLQEQVLGRLHYALSADGFLFLGTAESVPVSDSLFRRVKGFSHTYRKRIGSASDVANLVRKTSPLKRRWGHSQTDAAAGHLFQIERALVRQLALAAGENAILVDADMRIDRVFGDISRYVAIDSSSRLTFDISMLAPNLAREARTLATLALRRDQVKQGRAYPITEGGKELVQLKAIPLKATELDDGFALICFNKVSGKRIAAAEARKTSPGDSNLEIDDLQNELKSTREELQQTIEELETSTEELQASNEELQATNEELQATNEEYETTNEELQSTNEELITLNEELYVSKTEIEQTVLQQKAIVDSIDSPVIWVNTSMNIINYNKSAIEFYQFSDNIKGPHISKIRLLDGFPDYSEICREIILDGRSRAHEIATRDFLYIINFSPFFSETDELNSIAIVITKSKQAVEQTLLLDRVLSIASSKSPLYFMHRDRDGRIIDFNRTLEHLQLELDQKSSPQVRWLHDLYDATTEREVRALDDAFLRSGEASDVQTSRLVGKSGDRSLVLEVHRYRVTRSEDEEPTIFAIGLDISEKAKLSDELDHLMNVLPAMIMHRDRKGTIRQLSAGSAAIAGKSREDMIGRNIVDLVGKEFGERIISEDNELLDSDLDTSEYYANAIRPDGSIAWLRSERARYTPLGETEELVSGTATDVTELYNAQDRATRYYEILDLAARRSGLNYWIVDLETDEVIWSDGVYEIYGETRDSYQPAVESSIAFYHPDDVGMVTNVVETAMKDGDPFDFTARIRRKSGEEIPVRAVCEIFKRRGKISALIGIFHRLDQSGDSQTRH